MKHVAIALVLTCMIASAQAANYHVDPIDGNDANDGASPEHAWKSLDLVNTKVFAPGDHVLFKAGSRFIGQLKPQGSGKLIDGKPVSIFIDMYGQGAKPRIDGEGKFPEGLLLRNVEYWDVSNLEVTNLGPEAAAGRAGVRVVCDGFGPMHHIRLNELFVHDVNGNLTKAREGCGIFFETRGANQSAFDDLLIENCHVVHTDRNGICQRSAGRTRSTHVVIRHNLLEDIGGDGIKTWGSNGALIEYNTIHGGRMRAQDAAAGIWPWDCDDTVIQFNEVSGFKGTNDGQGFDSDYRCKNSLFQYNYSHDNDGGFFLLCSPGNSICEGTVIRYNISQNDGINSARVFHISGNVKNSSIYNNTIYIAPDRTLPMMLFATWSGGNPDNTRFYNNLFFVEGTVTYKWGKGTNNVFENNIFYGAHDNAPKDPATNTKKPPLADPGKGASGLASLAGYKPSVGADVPRGRQIADNGGRDFFGNPLPRDGPPTIGAAEASITKAPAVP